MSPPASLLNSLKDDIGAIQRFSTPSHGFQCLLTPLRMLVVPWSGSFRKKLVKVDLLAPGLELGGLFLSSVEQRLRRRRYPPPGRRKLAAAVGVRTIGAGKPE